MKFTKISAVIDPPSVDKSAPENEIITVSFFLILTFITFFCNITHLLQAVRPVEPIVQDVTDNNDVNDPITSATDDETRMRPYTLDEALMKPQTVAIEYAMEAPKVIPKVTNSVHTIHCELKRHQLRKHNNVEYHCDLCDCEFKIKHDIEQHLKRKHLTTSVECNNEIVNQTAQDVNDNVCSPIKSATDDETRMRPYSPKVKILSVENLPNLTFFGVTTTQMKLHRVDRHQSDISQHLVILQFFIDEFSNCLIFTHTFSWLRTLIPLKVLPSI